MTTDQPKSLSPDLLQAVGALIINASAIDHQVGLQVVRMISPIDIVLWHAWPIVSGMDFKVKLSVIRMMAAMEKPEARNYVVECCDQLQKFYGRRNHIAHYMTTGLSDDSGRFTFINMKGDPKTGVPQEPLKVTIPQIRDWGFSLFRWANELEQSLSDLGYPWRAPTEANIGVRPPEAQREANRPKSRTPRTIRKRPRPPDHS